MKSVLDIDIRTLDYASVLQRAAAEHGERPYLHFEERTYTFSDAHALSNRYANGLVALGVKPGEHIALMLDNCPEIAWYYFAIGKAGAVSVPLNTAAKGEMLARYLQHSNATTVVLGEQHLQRVGEVLGQCPQVVRVIVVTEDGTSAPQLIGASVVQVPSAALFDASNGNPNVPVRFNDLAYLSYTSGTSGPSKANMSTHSHSFSMAASLALALGYRENDVMYTCLPVFHGNAMRSLFIPFIVNCSVAMARRFSASKFWADVRRYRATQFNLLGAMANILWAQPPSLSDRDHYAKRCMIVPVPSFGTAFGERFGVTMTSVYALTDFGYLSVLGPDDPPEKWRSAGKPQPDVTVAILDDDDFEVATGEIGEICARPRRPWTSAQGYYGMPQSTVNAWRNLWFHSGDRGFIDADGYLYFVDRKKDAIRRRGENISSYEVEQLILKHPAVLEVAAFAVRSEMSEEEVMVSVSLRGGNSLNEAELIRHCEANMPYFMVPRFVEFVPRLPRTLTEKVEKYKLRSDAESRIGAIWDREKAGIRLVR